ncbi:L domain-like protein [Rhizoclosmatium globosum]|uniref:L domain-like protein n=1 Tax=Rhizoclosmatium globosum TaxID=329046 RepID=A0A1Y2CBZ1_9FUNG|nr:L domain-like protein [Rhizoclosmatium globosum]|eukprot:ORY44552.1 L domain-like protein [Rhizoclosmatium globosum]
MGSVLSRLIPFKKVALRAHKKQKLNERADSVFQFPNLPLEIGSEILSWLPPNQVMQYRRLSRTFDACLTSRYFATLNLSRFLGVVDTTATNRLTANSFDLLLPGLPKTYQEVYVSLELSSVVKLSWSYSKFRRLRIPDSLGTIDTLEYLDLSYCLLEGPIPTDFGTDTFKSLRVLRLHCNALSREIPESIGGIKQLEKLNLMFNKLSGPIPSTVGSLSNLKTLCLNGNRLTSSIPPEIGSLCSLEELYLNSNQLSGEIPIELANLGELRKLDISKNLITGSIRDEISQLSKLLSLDLSENHLLGSIPASLARMHRLRDLSLSSNNLSGKIPVEFGSSASLEHIHINCNKLSGVIPKQLGQLMTLRCLQVVGNNLTGSIPIELCALPRLRELHIADNCGITVSEETRVNQEQLKHAPLSQIDVLLTSSKEPPPPQKDPFKSTSIMVHQQNRSSHTSDSLAASPLEVNVLPLKISLRSLSTSPNRIFKLLHPSKLHPPPQSTSIQLPTLTYDIIFHILTYLPPSHSIKLRRLSQMFNTYLQSRAYAVENIKNFAVEKADAVICTAVDMTEYDRLWLVLPPAYAALYAESHLDTTSIDWPFMRMKAGAKVPPSLGMLNLLTRLNLGWCSLVGEIPRELGALVNLRVLELQRNDLSGEIPCELGNLVQLEVLNLSDNLLEGCLPRELFRLRTLKEFKLGHNRLSGELGEYVDGLQGLEVFDVSVNVIQGQIPAGFGNLRKLKELRLNDNSFVGEVPGELCTLVEMEVLMLNRNRLTGEFPSALERLPRLKELKVAHNQFMGPLPPKLRKATKLMDRLMMHIS